jgi:muconolactone delta-isomerase
MAAGSTPSSEGAGKGSSFTVDAAAGLERAARRGWRPRWQRGGNWRTAALMLVDDNVDAVTMLAALLAAAGHKVESFSDPRSALAAAPAAAPDAFVLDIGMPGMDGYELARRLRAAAGLPRRPLHRPDRLWPAGRPRDCRARPASTTIFVKPVDAG